MVEVSAKFRLVLMCLRITFFSSTYSWKGKFFKSMCLALFVGLLEFSVIITAVLSQNIFLVTCLENPRSCRMKEIYFSYLAPETVDIYSASVEIVDNVDSSLIW